LVFAFSSPETTTLRKSFFCPTAICAMPLANPCPRMIAGYKIGWFMVGKFKRKQRAAIDDVRQPGGRLEIDYKGRHKRKIYW
jgi:hypothetical protein